MKFSVIIPTYNRPDALRRCLRGFQQLSYPTWELIVVNDGGNRSFDGINEREFPELPLKMLDACHQGPAAARNYGAKQAEGDMLAFTDDDCVVEPDWLQQFRNGFTVLDAAALGGDWLNPYPENIGAVAWQLYMTFFRDYLRDASGNNLLLLSNNAAYHRAVFRDVGGFNAAFPLAAAEDLDLSHRIAAAGYRQQYYLEAKVWHEHQIDVHGFLRQQHRYGRGSVYFQQQHYSIRVVPRKRGEFFLRLAEFLWHHQAPAGVWILLGLAQFAHRLGKRYELQRIPATQKRFFS